MSEQFCPFQILEQNGVEVTDRTLDRLAALEAAGTLDLNGNPSNMRHLLIQSFVVPLVRAGIIPMSSNINRASAPVETVLEAQDRVGDVVSQRVNFDDRYAQRRGATHRVNPFAATRDPLPLSRVLN